MTYRTVAAIAMLVVGAYANVDRARDVLGWSSQLSVADGIESALAWMNRRRDVLGYA